MRISDWSSDVCSSDLIPFRGLVGEGTGANGERRRYALAVYAGTVRRGFLKGVGLERGCKTPARPLFSPSAAPSGTQPRWVQTPSVISQFSLPGLVRWSIVSGSRRSPSGTALASAISFATRLRTNTGCLRQLVLIACPGWIAEM